MASRTASGEAYSLEASARRYCCAADGSTFVLLIVFVFSSAPVSAQQGIIEVDNPRHNIGVIQEGQIVRRVFSITNTGEVPFSLTAVEPSCACTTAEWFFDSIGPGEQGEIAVEFDSEGHRGSFEHSIAVESTAAPARLDLYIQGRVEPRSLAAGDTLGSLVFGGFRTTLPVVKPGDPLGHPILIKNVGEQPIEISETRTDADFVSVELPQNVISPGAFIEINVAFATSRMRPGPFGHRIDLMTTDTDIPIKRILLTGLLQ